jgi:large subunit ribosomal protein L35
MPKIKTHRGAAKRFKATGKGRLKHKQPYHSHILTSKTAKRKRQLRLPALVSQAEEKSLKRLLPYL